MAPPLEVVPVDLCFRRACTSTSRWDCRSTVEGPKLGPLPPKQWLLASNPQLPTNRVVVPFSYGGARLLAHDERGLFSSWSLHSSLSLSALSLNPSATATTTTLLHPRPCSNHNPEPLAVALNWKKNRMPSSHLSSLGSAQPPNVKKKEVGLVGWIGEGPLGGHAGGIAFP
jgi:hypothetical protein